MAKWYRIVVTNPPTESDFLPPGKLGKIPRRPIAGSAGERVGAVSYFEVWDLASRNRLADMDTESEALAFVRELLATGDASYLTDLALGFTTEDGEKSSVAEGIELAARALANTRIVTAA